MGIRRTLGEASGLSATFEVELCRSTSQRMERSRGNLSKPVWWSATTGVHVKPRLRSQCSRCVKMPKATIFVGDTTIIPPTPHVIVLSDTPVGIISIFRIATWVVMVQKYTIPYPRHGRRTHQTNQNIPLQVRRNRFPSSRTTCGGQLTWKAASCLPV